MKLYKETNKKFFMQENAFHSRRQLNIGHFVKGYISPTIFPEKFELLKYFSVFLSKFLLNDCCKILLITRHLYSCDMCKNLFWSSDHQLNYNKIKFPSNLNCEWKKNPGKWVPGHHIDGLVQDCSISIALATKILQSCTKPSIWSVPKDYTALYHLVMW